MQRVVVLPGVIPTFVVVGKQGSALQTCALILRNLRYRLPWLPFHRKCCHEYFLKSVHPGKIEFLFPSCLPESFVHATLGQMLSRTCFLLISKNHTSTSHNPCSGCVLLFQHSIFLLYFRSSWISTSPIQPFAPFLPFAHSKDSRICNRSWMTSKSLLNILPSWTLHSHFILIQSLAPRNSLLILSNRSNLACKSLNWRGVIIASTKSLSGWN